jgi:tetratricopeptide (TPR) repeat protein
MGLGILILSLIPGPVWVQGAEPETNAAAPALSDTNAQETLRAYLQVQEQLHLTQLAIEQNRKEARELAAQNSEMLAGRLQTIEKALDSQRTSELETMQSSNRVILLVAGSFASVGFLAILLMSFFQWRTVHRLAEISAALPASLSFDTSPNRPALGPADNPLVTISPADQSSLRLVGALEQLEKRIHQLEHTSRPPLNERTASDNGGEASSSEPALNGNAIKPSEPEHPPDSGKADQSDRVNVLMGRGQSMLSLDDARGAVACFEEVLTLEPNNAEAWVRKGAALERLQQLDRAIECYDRAIAADSALTVAYLHKGGLFNRMERFSEALECYEKALRTQEKRHG